MPLPTEPIGSIARPLELIEAVARAPFSDDTSTTRETAFPKIRARVLGTAMASEARGGDS